MLFSKEHLDFLKKKKTRWDEIERNGYATDKVLQSEVYIFSQSRYFSLKRRDMNGENKNGTYEFN